MELLIFIVFIFVTCALVRFAIVHGVSLILYTTTRLVLFPVIPFIIAHRVRTDKPVLAKSLIILWSLVYTMVGIIIVI